MNMIQSLKAAHARHLKRRARIEAFLARRSNAATTDSTRPHPPLRHA